MSKTTFIKSREAPCPTSPKTQARWRIVTHSTDRQNRNMKELHPGIQHSIAWLSIPV